MVCLASWAAPTFPTSPPILANLSKWQPADFATVLADIQQRDYQDSHRAVAPLKQAEDAILVDTSDIGLQESFDLLKRTILAHI